jgi:CcmD family protein
VNVYLFAGYAAVWIILFAYVTSISSKQKKIEDEMEMLRKLVERKK